MASIDISENYQNEFLAFRYAVMLHSTDCKSKAEAIKNLLELSKKLQWVYYQDELVRTAKSDSQLNSLIGNILSETIIDPIYLKPIEEIEAFFTRLNPKDIESNSKKIRELALILFSKGCFNQYNIVFSRYIKYMKELTDDEMHEFIIKYLLCSVIKKNYENAITDITNLKQIYKQFDLTIYTFLLKFIYGAFHDAFEDSLIIGNNLYERVWDLINENDLAFYFTLTLLIRFDRKVIREIQSQNSILIYNIFQGDYEEYHNFLDNYVKCRYDYVTDFFEGYKQKILLDPLMANNVVKINYEVKTNILKEILNSCSKVGLDYLCKILRERESEKVENWILSGIYLGHYRVRFDDVDKIVYGEDQDVVRENVEKVVDLSRKVYSQSNFKILNQIAKKVDIKDIDINEFKRYKLEKTKGKERRDEDHDIYMDY